MDEAWFLPAVILLIGLLLSTGRSERKYMSGERQAILEELLNSSKYDSTISPDFEKDVATNVTVQMLIVNIYSVSEVDMEFSIDVFFRQKWVDTRLAYLNRSTSDWLELDNKLMEKVWVPDTFFANEKEAHRHDVTVPNKMMHLYNNGTVLYSMRLSLTLSCDLQLNKYPLDEQQCPVMIESYGYTVENILFKWNPVRPIELAAVEMPQFKASTVLNYQTSAMEYFETGRFACLKAYIHLQRKVGYYMVQVFIPSFLIVVLSWVSFWVEADSVPARVSLGVLTVLTMTTQSSASCQSLPHVSYIKAIDVWMAACMVFVFSALLEFAYVNVLCRRCQRESAKIVTLQQVNGTTKEANTTPKSSNKNPKQVDKISRVAFPAVFLFFNVVFWMYYMFLPNSFVPHTQS